MMTNMNLRYGKTLLAMIILILQACSLEEDIALLPEDTLRTSSQLGKKLQNPYSVANMQLAWDNLQQRDGLMAKEELLIAPTHLYVKFLPQSEEELDLLNRDESLILYSYPLDYEAPLNHDGEEYREAGLKEGQPTPQYASVPIDQVLLDGVSHEILSELFIPDERSDESSGRVAEDWIVDELVHEALRITDNLTEGEEVLLSKENAGRTEMSDWRPAGRIQVWDNSVGSSRKSRQVFSHYEYYDCPSDISLQDDNGNMLIGDPSVNPIGGTTRCRRAVYRTEYYEVPGSYVGVHDLEVRANRWFTTHTGKTDINGNFSVGGTFKNDANYSLKWQKYHFSVRTGTFGQAVDNGPKMRGNWNRNYGRSGSETVVDKQQYYALIFQAARDYYYGNRFGLESPPKNGTLNPQTKISASQEDRQHDKRSHAAPYARTGGIFPTVYVRRWDSSADRVYGVTIHELAHNSHWNLNRDAFRSVAVNAWNPFFPWALLPGRDSYAALIESWARGVEWMFASHRYRNTYSVQGYTYRGNFQWVNRRDESIYTSIVIDLIDNIDQGDPRDRVSGYTIRQLEQSLDGARSWEEWRDRIRDQHQNGSEQFLDELFEYWHD